MKHKIENVPFMEGLHMCTVCGAAEGQLPTDCPGVEMEPYQLEEVSDGDLDYVGGTWVTPQKKWWPPRES